jgi:GNAT superfamily N-acetyltransferase
MSSVLHFRRQLNGPPDVADVAGIRVRNVLVPDDVPGWLQLRDRAMGGEIPRARSWSESDFNSEMLGKSWWRPQYTWVAIAGDLRVAGGGEGRDGCEGQLVVSGELLGSGDRRSPAIGASGADTIVGSVTLALREGHVATMPVVHWLLVDPLWRRRGVARLLMSHLELAAWNDGWREIELETHAGWASAVAFYQSIGYAPVRDHSPR